MANNSYMKNVVVVGLKLLLICAVIAGVVSFVYTVTWDSYQKNLDREIRQSMAVIFNAGENDEIDPVAYDGELAADIQAVYTVKINGETVGYCVNVIGKGFGGDMSLMVGYKPDKSILGVSIVSHSETPGVGSKVGNETHLSQYDGLSGELTISKRGDADITAISGATISSKAVHEAVLKANSALALIPVA